MCTYTATVTRWSSIDSQGQYVARAAIVLSEAEQPEARAQLRRGPEPGPRDRKPLGCVQAAQAPACKRTVTFRMAVFRRASFARSRAVYSESRDRTALCVTRS